MRKYLWIFSLGGLIFEGGQSSCVEPSIFAPTRSIPSLVPPKHILFTTPPQTCTKQGAPVKKDGFNMLFWQFDCTEQCRVAVVTPPMCENFDYRNVSQLSSEISGQEISVGGHLFQINFEQPCSVKGMKCCYSCNSYVSMVDFEDKIDRRDCRRIFFPEQVATAAQMFSIEAPSKCCLLDDFNLRAIVTGKIHVEEERWSFSEVSSICRLP